MKIKTTYYCKDCGNETPKWQGKCPACGAWNTLTEHTVQTAVIGKAQKNKSSSLKKPKILSEVEGSDEIRFTTGMGELDRVLGGGGVKGSLILVAGAPGIGKSTLLLQICTNVCKMQTVLYVSGEESERQLKLRAQRLCVDSERLFILSETNLSDIIEAANTLNPDMLIVDSIQTLCSDENQSSPGSISQVKDCTMSLMQLCKSNNITTFIVGHVNKEGSIAGPKVLEHMVDCVLYFEGDQNNCYRLLRAAKNRFGSTNEIGVFEMIDTGLKDVPNPSELMLAGRPMGAPGTCVACTMEGTRPVLTEVQALVTKSALNVPRRTTNGFDFNRAILLLAVMEKRSHMHLGTYDAYINVIGGLHLDEPAADLPVVIAVASSYRDTPISDQLTAIGEVGLTGEIRTVSNMSQRLAEISRLGFNQCIIPQCGTEHVQAPDGLKLIRVNHIREAIAAGLSIHGDAV